METLTRHPTRRPRAPESDKFGEDLHELLYGEGRNKYRILFAIREADVVELFVHHGARREQEP